MAQTFHSFPVKDLEKTTSDCTVITLDIPADQAEAFAFKQGQYLTFKADINGEEIRRSYSLCSAPSDGEWKVAVKKIEDGRFSTFANDVLRVGDMVEVMPPQGKFYVETDSSKANNYVAFAAGSGITPICSIIKTHLEAEPNSTFKLFYVNQATPTIILREELEGLKNQYLDRFEIFHFLTREERSAPLFNGRIDESKLDEIMEHFVNIDHTDHYFICGPNAMIFLIRDYLYAKEVDKSKVHFELFNTEGMVGTKKKRKVDTSILSEVSILEGGKTFKFSIPKGSDNILDAALTNNADLPFACKGGVCCTCRALLVEGEVDMDIHYGLEQEELDAGYILTCQAIPTTEKVVVDFDASMSTNV